MEKVIATNRKAFHAYEILDKIEAGIVLTGTEVKSLRGGHVQMSDSYAWPLNGELWLQNLHISEYKQGNIFNHEVKRDRKLLLHKKEMQKLISRAQEKGLNIVPLRIYFKRGLVKVELGLGRGKKLHDKRDTLKKKDIDREHKREFKGKVKL